ncbi:hypothetical protein E2562_036121 [Oryza meyeriana var. granulata]|uniref:Uncharacterized protein n=1 Tax=Oryza meyeriana var. granulata TaxID=110450 RepID=A0A6G1CL67_9ORYZ|nr:hypothetical protein E2562_036121 [Oryza meyeriana var. granulata]
MKSLATATQAPLGVHISCLPADLRQPVINAIGVYNHQAKVAIDEIAKQIYLVQTRQAPVYDKIVRILNDNTTIEKTPPKGSRSFSHLEVPLLPGTYGIAVKEIETHLPTKHRTPIGR